MIVVKNITFQILGKIVTVLATIIGISLITSHFGVEFYGQFIFVVTYITVFFTFSDWGINSIVVNKLSQQDSISKEYFTKVFVTRVLFAILMCLFALLALVMFRFEKNITDSILVGLPMVFGYVLWSTASIIFQTQHNYKLDFLTKIAYSSFSVGTLFYVLKFTDSLLVIVFTLVIGWSVAGLLSVFFVRKSLELKSFKLDYNFTKVLLITSLPVGVSLIINTLLSQADKLIIPNLLDFRQAGYYGLSYKGFEFLLVLPTFFVNSIFVLLSKKDYNKLIFENSIKILIFSSVVLTFISIGFAPNIIKLLSSQDFSSSVIPFQVLAFGLLPFFITALLRHQLVVEGKEKLFFYIYISSLILNIILNLLLLPAIGIVGASFATILAELIVLALMIKEVNVSVITKHNLLYLNKVILVCSLAFLPVVFLTITSVLLKIGVTFILFMLFSYVFGLLNQLILMVKSIEEKITN